MHCATSDVIGARVSSEAAVWVKSVNDASTPSCISYRKSATLSYFYTVSYDLRGRLLMYHFNKLEEFLKRSS